MACRTPATCASALDGGDATPTPTVGGMQKYLWRERMIYDTLARLLDRENLANDSHMGCLMHIEPQTSRVGIPAVALLSHPLISSMLVTPDELIRQIFNLVADDLLEASADGQVIYPLMKAKRKTLIIRNPEHSEDEYKNYLLLRCPLLPNQPSAIIESHAVQTPFSKDIFITFRTEDMARNVAMWLLQNGYDDGTPLQVAIKSESQYAPCQFVQSYDPSMVYDYSSYTTIMKQPAYGYNRTRASAEGTDLSSHV